jgi:hypothetical protein
MATPRNSLRWPPLGLEPIDDAENSAADVRCDRTVEAVIGWDLVESELQPFAAEPLKGLGATHPAMLVHHGRAIVVPGPSHTGKSALALTAIDASVTAASGEYALLDLKSGLVHDWARPLCTRRADGRIEPRALPPSSNEPVPVIAVAAIRYDLGGPPIAPIRRAAATMALLENCVRGVTRPSDAFDAVVGIISTSQTAGGTHADSAQALEQLLGLLGGRCVSVW